MLQINSTTYLAIGKLSDLGPILSKSNRCVWKVSLLEVRECLLALADSTVGCTVVPQCPTRSTCTRSYADSVR